MKTSEIKKTIDDFMTWKNDRLLEHKDIDYRDKLEHLIKTILAQARVVS